jgi:RNA polymerase-binding transcription factor DksA
MTLDTQHFKELLQKEASVIENELGTLGRKNVTTYSDWEAVQPEMDRDRAEEGEVADNIEQYESNSAVLNQLEIRLNEVKNALEKIEKGVYGKCEVGGETIELDRLEANPAATTCKVHMG